MIRIEKISIHKFRGIVKLELELGGENFAICGPNGTGKSGVVDAIEFVLSGDISRLGGTGRGNVSVKEHAPHVDYRDLPDKAFVELHGVIVSTGKKFSVKRSVGQPKAPTISPNIPEVVEAIDEFGRHKNVALSRRELIQYILSTPGQRAEEIQALLQLDLLASLRKNLQSVSNSKKKEYTTKVADLRRASENLATALSIPALKTADLLKAVNKRRALLDLPEIKSLESGTSVKDGLSVTSADSQASLSKTIALKDMSSCSEYLKAFTSEEFGVVVAAQLSSAKSLAENTDFNSALDKQDLLDKSLKLVDGDYCPVCDTSWKQHDLIAHIEKKKKDLEQFTKQKNDFEKALEPITKTLGDVVSLLRTVAPYGAKLKVKLECPQLKSFADEIESSKDSLVEFSSMQTVVDVLESLGGVPKEVDTELVGLLGEINSIPDTSERDTARDYLVAAQERLSAYREIKRTEARALQDSKLAKTVFETYETTHTNGLNKVYSDIQDYFAGLYSEINKDDEEDFEASMESSGAQLGLDVEFYGRGKFPPGAYHSEGHQDAMGLCLYLALMNHLYKDKFTFCVLDDVLMSVDGGHRRAVCELLMKTFPDTQFIFTTHDQVWLNNMQTTGLVKKKSSVLFRNWNVDDGPSEWIGKDIWKEIENHIDKNDIQTAAAELRHYLEFLSGQLCHNLGASVVYRGDNRHTLGDLMPQATARFLKIIKDARSAAKSWELVDVQEELEALRISFVEAVTSTQLEQWAVNAKVHYNEWASLDKNDFKPVVASFREMISFLECDKCKSILYVIENGGQKESLRCSCGDQNINLKKK
jgi:AAA domain